MRISDWSSDVCSSDLGAAAFLARLPAERWAVVTSAPRALAYVRIAAAGLPMPPLVIGAEDVAKGKPAPDGFLAAAARLGVAPGDCLAWEDSPAGIAAASAAGMHVVTVGKAHEATGTADVAIFEYWSLDLVEATQGPYVVRRKRADESG